MKTFSSLSVRQLEKKVGNFLLRANFDVKRGERLALIGPSGCGKTTLLRLLSGLIQSDRGEILIGDRHLTDLPPEKRNVGMIFQDLALFPQMSVLENVTFGLKMRDIAKDQREQIGLELLNRLNLKSRAKDGVQLLSGGEAQRVAFARALALKPDYFLLDEPFSSLDENLRGDARSLLKDLHAEWPAPLVFVTHDSRDVQDLASRALRISESADRSLRSFDG